MENTSLNRLVAAVRNLGIRRKGQRGASGSLIIEGNRNEFPDRLYDLSETLDDIVGNSDETCVPDEQKALDIIVSWMEHNGMDASVPKGVIDHVVHGKDVSASVRRLVRSHEQKMEFMGNVAPKSRKINISKSPSR